jgi:hypothetical protein
MESLPTGRYGKINTKQIERLNRFAMERLNRYAIEPLRYGIAYAMERLAQNR